MYLLDRLRLLVKNNRKLITACEVREELPGAIEFLNQKQLLIQRNFGFVVKAKTPNLAADRIVLLGKGLGLLKVAGILTDKTRNILKHHKNKESLVLTIETLHELKILTEENLFYFAEYKDPVIAIAMLRKFDKKWLLTRDNPNIDVYEYKETFFNLLWRLSLKECLDKKRLYPSYFSMILMLK